jgi:hypothetical protein
MCVLYTQFGPLCVLCVSGLEHCLQLQCLSMGNNYIATLDSVTRLRYHYIFITHVYIEGEI